MRFEPAQKLRRHAQQGEEIKSRRDREYISRRAAACQNLAVRSPGCACDLVETAAVLPERFEVPVRCEQLRWTARVDSTVPYRHQPARLPVWQWPQQHRVKNAEYRGARANAERQRQDHRCSRSRRTAEI